MRRLMVVALVAGGLATTGLAEVVLDQSFEAQTGTFSAVNDTYSKAQTFTVGTSGCLERVELCLYRNTQSYALVVDVRPASGSGPELDDGSALATASIPVYALPYREAVWYSVDLSAAQVQVQAGQMLAVTLRSDTAGGYGWEYGSNGYAGGQGYVLDRDEPVPAWADSTHDHSFRTYVTIPEPTGMLCLLAGLGYAVMRSRVTTPVRRRTGRRPT